MTSLSTHQWWIGKKGWWYFFYKDKKLSLENLDKYKYHLVFPGGSDGKESSCNAGNLGLIPRLGRSPGEGNGYPLQYSGLENSMDRGAWWAIVHGVAKSWTWLSDFHITFKQPFKNHPDKDVWSFQGSLISLSFNFHIS